jgi:hypothetical protein
MQIADPPSHPTPSPVEFALEDLPFAAVATHGGGADALAALRRAMALDVVVGVSDVIGAGRDPLLVAQAGAIADWLYTLSVDRLCHLAEQPLLRVWLADTRRARRGDDTVGDIDDLLGALPLLFLSQLEQIDGARSDWDIVVPATPRLAPIDADQWILSGGAAPLRTSASRLPELATRPRTRVLGGIELLDPYAFPELFRPAAGAKPAGVEPLLIAGKLADGFDLLLAAWPEAVADVRSCCGAVIAVDAPRRHVYSASTRELPLVLQLTLRADEHPTMVAEALVHETAHVKLDALDHLAPLLENGEQEGFHHPWREDPRTLRGVLLGAHAFLNVALFYQRMAAAGISPDEAAREIAQRRREVAEALDTLDQHAVFTPAGQRLFDRLVTANSR